MHSPSRHYIRARWALLWAFPIAGVLVLILLGSARTYVVIGVLAALVVANDAINHILDHRLISRRLAAEAATRAETDTEQNQPA